MAVCMLGPLPILKISQFLFFAVCMLGPIPILKISQFLFFFFAVCMLGPMRDSLRGQRGPPEALRTRGRGPGFGGRNWRPFGLRQSADQRCGNTRLGNRCRRLVCRQYSVETLLGIRFHNNT